MQETNIYSSSSSLIFFLWRICFNVFQIWRMAHLKNIYIVNCEVLLRVVFYTFWSWESYFIFFLNALFVQSAFFLEELLFFHSSVSLWILYCEKRSQNLWISNEMKLNLRWTSVPSSGGVVFFKEIINTGDKPSEDRCRLGSGSSGLYFRSVSFFCHGDTTQNAAIFVFTVVRISNPPVSCSYTIVIIERNVSLSCLIWWCYFIA